MVHALEKAASCLNSGGVILEIHDLVDPPRIEVHSDHAEIFAGQLLTDNNFEIQRLADQAINQVIAAGKLSSAQAIIFESYIRADSFTSMAEYMDEEWESAYIPEDTKQQVIDIVAQLGENSEVVTRFVSRLNLFKPILQQK